MDVLLKTLTYAYRLRPKEYLVENERWDPLTAGASSVLGTMTDFTSALGGAFPLFATQMYHKLGVNWASSVLGFITIAMIPIPVLFFFYGAKIRAMSRFTPKF